MPDIVVTLTNGQWAHLEAAFRNASGASPTLADWSEWFRRKLLEELLRREAARLDADSATARQLAESSATGTRKAAGWA